MNCPIILILFIIIIIKTIIFRKLVKELIQQIWTIITKQNKTIKPSKNLLTIKGSKKYFLPTFYGKIIYKYFNIMAWIYVISIFIILILVGQLTYNYVAYDNCNGKNSEEYCLFSSLEGGLLEKCTTPGIGDLIVPTQEVGISLGSPSYPIHIIEFGCYTCQESKESFSIVRELLETYPKQIYFTYIDFPLPKFNYSFETAEFTRCVDVVSPEKYWTFHSEIRDTVNEINEKYLFELTKTLSINSDEIKSCLESGVGSNIVKKEKLVGVTSNIYKASTFFVNGVGIEQPNNFLELKALITP